MPTAVIHPGALGDLVLALPLIQSLAERGPVELVAGGERARLLAGRSAVASAAGIDGLPLADLFVTRPPAARVAGPLANWLARFDLVVSALPSQTFTANLRTIVRGEVVALDARPAAIEASGLHASQFLHRQVVDVAAPLPEVRATPADREAGRALLSADPGRPTLLVHPGSGGRAKCWPISSFLDVAARVRADGWQVAFVIGPAERERFAPADLAAISARFRLLDDLSLAQLLAAIASADCYLGNDSGPTHLAAAVGRATVAVFGPTEPAVWAPRGRRVTILRGDPRRGPGWGIDAACILAGSGGLGRLRKRKWTDT